MYAIRSYYALAARRRGPIESKISRLSEYLLTSLIQHPELVKELSAERRDDLLALDDCLLARLVRHLVDNPDADTAALRITSYNVCYTKLLRHWHGGC